MNSLSCYSKLIGLKEVAVRIYSQWSEPQVTTWTCSWYLKWEQRQSCRTESLMCRIWLYFHTVLSNFWLDRIRMELNSRTPSWCRRIVLYVNPPALPPHTYVVMGVLYSSVQSIVCSVKKNNIVCFYRYKKNNKRK